MAYGKNFRFVFESQNGSNIEIDILKKDYLGDVITRPLGRAPMLKRESNECIWGTSLEIYAESKVAGEYATLYTSSPDEYKVELYKDNELIWVGFVSPELYSEPEMAPPYDVQIIATDGLGELKLWDFVSDGRKSIENHIKWCLKRSGLSLAFQTVSSLQGEADDVLDLLVNMDHMDGTPAYDVLQQLLASMHAVITQQKGKWMLMRENDLRANITSRGMGVKENGVAMIQSVESFGPQTATKWWPVGMLSRKIDPACKKVSIVSNTSYFNPYNKWVMTGNLISYDSVNKAYVLADASNLDGASPVGGIKQTISSKHNFNWSMTLKFKALLTLKDTTDNENARSLGIKIQITDQYGTTRYYYKWSGSWSWVSNAGQTDRSTSQYQLNEGENDIEITFPLQASDRMPLTAKDITIEVRRWKREDGEIRISDIELVPAVQYPEVTVSGKIGNGAREEAKEVEIAFPASYVLAYTSNPQDTVAACPIHPTGLDYAFKWSRPGVEEDEYSKIIIADYAQSVALPRMHITGVLNVPQYGIPSIVFKRDNEYFLLKNFSYDLYNDEIDVLLIGLPTAVVEVEDVEENTSKQEYTTKYN